MRALRHALAVLGMLLCLYASGQDFGIWGAVDGRIGINEKWSAGFRAEVESVEGCRAIDCWFFRSIARYKPVKWLQFGATYEIIDVVPVYIHRALIDAALIFSPGDFSITLMERAYFVMGASAPVSREVMFFHFATAAYRPQGWKVYPFADAQFFYRPFTVLQQQRLEAGFKVELDSHNTLAVGYLNRVSPGNPMLHTVDVCWQIAL